MSDVEKIIRRFVEFVASFHGELDAQDLVDAFMEEYEKSK